MNECERISNLTGGKPILPQCDYQYFGEKGWPFMNSTRDIVSSLLSPFEFPHTVGVGVWSDDDAQGQPADRNKQNQRFIDETLKPIVNDFTSKSCACSKTKCSGHGRCYIAHPPYPPPLPPPPPPGPHPPPSPSPGPPKPPPPPHPQPGPKQCTQLIEGLAGPNVTNNKFCSIPKCTATSGCPTNTTRCVTCIQSLTTGAHAKALQRAGCTQALITSYCDSLGKPSQRAAAQRAKQGEPLQYTGPLFGEDSLCFCDAGYHGADCSQPDAPAAAAEPQQHGNIRSDPTGSILCPDGRSSCPSSSSCASISTGAWGCCATPNAVVCDCTYCCPQGYVCNTTGGVGTATHCEKQH
eukprot:COSAG01_NODE_6674_length_3551_cov_21.128042_2_plen_352_part_00